MTIGDSRYGSGDPSGRSRMRPQQLPGGTAGGQTSGGRKLAKLDNGTVALALSGMAFYWLMPALMSRGRKGRRVVRPARRPRPAPSPAESRPSEPGDQ